MKRNRPMDRDEDEDESLRLRGHETNPIDYENKSQDNYSKVTAD